MSDTLCDKNQDLSRCVDLQRLYENITLDFSSVLGSIVHGEQCRCKRADQSNYLGILE